MEPARTLAMAAMIAVAAPAGVVAADAAGYLPQDFGLCTAHGHLPEDGNATQADAFQNLSERADHQDRSVQEHCNGVPHPGQHGLDRAQQARGDAGDPAQDDAADRRGPPGDVPPSHARDR